MGKNTFLSFFDPHPTQDFLGNFYGKTLLHLIGTKGRFHRLLPWEKLNHILSHHRLDYPRIRLSKDGQNIPSETFIRQSPARRGGTIPRLKVASLFEQLRAGATLIMDAIDEAHGPIGELAEYLERLLHEYVQVNVYVGWGETSGFDLHWDDHDVIIVQVNGRKNWKVYGPTRLYPLYRDVEPNFDPPKEQPMWEGTLNDGDLLYIPRGWWHVAIPVNEPTIHLTCGIGKRCGVDLITWLADQLRSQEAFRMDLPRFGNTKEQASHMAKLRTELLAMWDDEVLTKFLRDLDERAQPRTHTSFPWAVQAEVLPPTDDVILKLTVPRSTAISTTEDGQVIFTANARTWTFAKPAAAVLEYMLNEQLCSLQDLYRISEGILPHETVKAFVGELVLEGIMAIVSVES
jgi:ribosomal protein L16 Arg81 hydroxylase